MSPRKLIVASLLLILQNCNGETDNPIIKRIFQTGSSIGKEANIECTVENLGSFEQRWSKVDETNSKIIISEGESLIISDPRFALAYDNDTTTYFLWISGLSQQDAGTYQCEIINPVDDDVVKLSEVIIHPINDKSNEETATESRQDNLPSITYISEKQTVYEGTVMTLYCQVANVVGNNYVGWFKTNNSVNIDYKMPISLGRNMLINDARYNLDVEGNGDQYTLKIYGVDTRDTDTYSCQIISPNSNNALASKNVEVVIMAYSRPPHQPEKVPEVYLPPVWQESATPEISYITPAQQVGEGNAVILECAVQDADDFAVLWNKVDKNNHSMVLHISTEDTLLVREPRYNIKYDIPRSTYIFEISGTQMNDSGIYRCEIQKPYGTSIIKDVQLNVFNNAPVPEAPNLRDAPEKCCKDSKGDFSEQFSNKLSDRIMNKIIPKIRGIEEEHRNMQQLVLKLRTDYSNLKRQLPNLALHEQH